MTLDKMTPAENLLRLVILAADTFKDLRGSLERIRGLENHARACSIAEKALREGAARVQLLELLP